MRSPITPDDPRHGENRGYIAGCRDVCCRTAHAEESRQRTRNPRPTVPAVGTRRRLQALACLGWSGAELSKRLGKTQFYVQHLLLQERVYQATHAAVAQLYDELSMTWSTHTWAPRAAAEARAKGWAPPLAWDDEDLDNPDAHPYTSFTPIAVDDVVVQRVLAGEWSLPTTKQEKTEVSRRFVAAGGSLSDLERLTGWKSGRYYRIRDKEAA